MDGWIILTLLPEPINCCTRSQLPAILSYLESIGLGESLNTEAAAPASFSQVLFEKGPSSFTNIHFINKNSAVRTSKKNWVKDPRHAGSLSTLLRRSTRSHCRSISATATEETEKEKKECVWGGMRRGKEGSMY